MSWRRCGETSAPGRAARDGGPGTRGFADSVWSLEPGGGRPRLRDNGPLTRSRTVSCCGSECIRQRRTEDRRGVADNETVLRGRIECVLRHAEICRPIDRVQLEGNPDAAVIVDATGRPLDR